MMVLAFFSFLFLTFSVFTPGKMMVGQKSKVLQVLRAILCFSRSYSSFSFAAFYVAACFSSYSWLSSFPFVFQLVCFSVPILYSSLSLSLISTVANHLLSSLDGGLLSRIPFLVTHALLSLNFSFYLVSAIPITSPYCKFQPQLQTFSPKAITKPLVLSETPTLPKVQLFSFTAYSESCCRYPISTIPLSSITSISKQHSYFWRRSKYTPLVVPSVKVIIQLGPRTSLSFFYILGLPYKGRTLVLLRLFYYLEVSSGRFGKCSGFSLQIWLVWQRRQQIQEIIETVSTKPRKMLSRKKTPGDIPRIQSLYSPDWWCTGWD